MRHIARLGSPLLHGARSVLLCAGCCVALVAVQPVRADDVPAATAAARTDYVAFLPGYVLESKKMGTNGSGFNFAGLYGHPLGKCFGFEVNVNASVLETGINGGTDFYQKGINLDLVCNLTPNRGTAFTPFVLAGVGGVYDDLYPNSRDGGAFIGGVGIGFVTAPLFKDGILLRAEARYVYDAKEHGYSEPRISLGIEIPIGRVERSTVYLPAREVEVHEVVKEVVKEVPRPFVDSDADGVDDDHDKCPDTPRGLRVDANGCVITPQVIELTGVNFRFNQSELTDNAESVLDMVSRAFIGQPSLRVEIAGHTDSIGGSAYNMKLSERRAESVRGYLISKAVHPEQLTAHGYGATQPLIHPEADDRDRERNRRVEFRVLSGQ